MSSQPSWKEGCKRPMGLRGPVKRQFTKGLHRERTGLNDDKEIQFF